MVAAIGTGGCVSRKARDFGAWLGARAETDIDRRPHDPRQDIKARQSLSCAFLFVQAAWVCVGQDRAKALGPLRAQVVDRGRKGSAYTTTWLAVALANKLRPHRLGRFLHKGARPSSASRPMKQRTDPLNPRAVLGARQGVAWQRWRERQGKARRPTLTLPCAPAHLCTRRSGTKETAARHEQRNSANPGGYR